MFSCMAPSVTNTHTCVDTFRSGTGVSCKPARLQALADLDSMLVLLLVEVLQNSNTAKYSLPSKRD